MMKYGKGELVAMEAALDGEYATVGEAAKAALLAAEAIFVARCKFVVVGQLEYSPEHGALKPNHPEAVKVGLGWYSTEGDARTAAESLVHSAASGDQFRVWVLNTFHGTAAEWHADRREHYAALEARQAEARQKRAHDANEKRELDALIRSLQWTWPCECGHMKDGHSTSPQGKRCVTFGCGCAEYRISRLAEFEKAQQAIKEEAAA